MQHHRTPVDLIGAACLTRALIQQAIDTSYPYPNQGGIIWAQSAPDVVADPILGDYIWGLVDGTGAKTSSLYYYDGAAWQLIPIVDGSLLAAGSVTLDKLSLTGSSPYYIIQVNAAGTALVWRDIIAAIQDDTITTIKLKAPDAINDYILTSFAGVKAFATFAAFIAKIASNTVPVDKLVRAAADTLGFYLRTKLDGTGIEWANVDIANVAAAAGVASQYLRRNAGNTAWEFAAVNSGPSFIVPVSAYSGSAIAWTTYAGSMATLAGKKAAILQTECLWGTATDGQVLVYGRKDSLSSSYILGRAGSSDAVATANQAILPVTADGKFDYQVTLSGSVPAITADINLIGYFD